MRLICTLMVLLQLNACAIQTQSKQHQVLSARKQADQMGNSGPLYDLYEGCLNNHWEAALSSGQDAVQAFASGRDQCQIELAGLCDFYAIGTCYQDAETASRVLFFLLREKYVSTLNQ